MEEKCEIELTEGYHSINSRDVRLHIHKGKNAWVDQLYDKNIFRRNVLFSANQNADKCMPLQQAFPISSGNTGWYKV